MASKLFPFDASKSTVIRDITPQITTFSTPFLRFGRIKIGGRSTVVKLQSGALAVFSPVSLTSEVQQKIDSLGGNVQYITAPDFEHHIYVTPWAKAFPNAKVIGVEGLPEKRKSNPEHRDTEFHHVFTKEKKALAISDEFDQEFESEYVHSHTNKELVFLHKPSRTMIEADLMFNLPATEQFSKTDISPTAGVLTKLFAGMMNLKGDATWHKRFLWYAASASDREGFKKSVAAIDKWDFDRIIPCHGDVIETGGKGVYDNLMQWFRK